MDRVLISQCPLVADRRKNVESWSVTSCCGWTWWRGHELFTVYWLSVEKRAASVRSARVQIQGAETCLFPTWESYTCKCLSMFHELCSTLHKHHLMSVDQLPAGLSDSPPHCDAALPCLLVAGGGQAGHGACTCHVAMGHTTMRTMTWTRYYKVAM